jgi:hypothetical protein
MHFSFTLYTFCVHGSVHRESVSIIVQQNATFYSCYSLQTAINVSGDIFTHHQEREYTVITASGTDRTVCHLPLSSELVLIPQRQQKVAYGSVRARCCNYSLLALLMMGGVARNMYSSLQGIKTVQSRILLDNY